MERGFAVAKQGESVVARAAQADTKKELTVAFEDGELNCKISGVRLYEQ